MLMGDRYDELDDLFQGVACGYEARASMIIL